jgi:hypothetical protein
VASCSKVSNAPLSFSVIPDTQRHVNLLQDALNNKRMELVMQRSFVSAAKSSGYKDPIIKDIVDLKMTPALEKEFEFQKANILY